MAAINGCWRVFSKHAPPVVPKGLFSEVIFEKKKCSVVLTVRSLAMALVEYGPQLPPWWTVKKTVPEKRFLVRSSEEICEVLAIPYAVLEKWWKAGGSIRDVDGPFFEFFSCCQGD